MPQEVLRQNTFTQGELDPVAHRRRDLKFYYASVAEAVNMTCRPQGPLVRRPGLAFVDRVRNRLEIVGQVGSEITINEAAMGVTNPYVMVEWEFEAPVTVSLVDVIDYGVNATIPAPPQYPWDSTDSPSTVRESLAVQYLDGDEEWQFFGPAVDMGSLYRNRRIGPGPGLSATSAGWRLVKIGTHDWGAFLTTINEVVFWRETDELSIHRRWSFDFDAADQRYSLIATEGNLEVYHRSERVASVALPYFEDEIPEVRRAQSLDTLVAFHRDVRPQRLTRQGAHGEWEMRQAEFKNIPIFDYEGTNAGGVNEVQQLTFKDYVANDTFNLTLEGETTAAIDYTATTATLAQRIEDALAALPNVGAGGVDVVWSGTAQIYEITFIGENIAQDLGDIVPATISSAAGSIIQATLVQGVPGGEAMMSVTRGWPATGCFFGQRLIMGGFRSRPQTVVGSVLGFFFDLQTKGAGAEKGFSVDLSTDEATQILALHPGIHLQVFTRAAEFYCTTEPLTPPPFFKRTTKRGMAPGTPLIEMDGSTLFVGAGGQAIMDSFFQEEAQNYNAVPLSAYASHLVGGVIDAGYRRFVETSKADLGLFVLESGAAAAMHALRAQDVLGFTPWTTSGAFTAAGAELAGDLFVCTGRVADGEDAHFFERLDEGRFLDCSVLYEGPWEDPPAEVACAHLEGRTVVVYIDGADAGDAVVTDGLVPLPYPPLRSVEVGLLFVPRGKTLPGVLEQDPRAAAESRVHTGQIAFDLGPTANLYAGAAGKRKWPVKLKRRPGALLDQGPGEDAFEGPARLFPVPGFSQEPAIEWEQPRPGPLMIKEIIVTVTS